MKPVLVMNVNWLGDCLFSLPVFHALAGGGERAVDCLALRRVAPLLKLCPQIREIICLDDERFAGWTGPLRLVWELRRRGYDEVYHLHRSRGRALLAWLAGIPRRVGYDVKGRGWMLTDAVPFAAGRHRLDEYLGVVEAAGVPVNRRWIELAAPEEAVRKFRVILEENGLGAEERYAVLHTSGNWELKRWPALRFSALADRLFTEAGLTPVLCGSDKERPLSREIAAACREKCVDMTGRTRFAELLALMAGAAVVVSNDSGPMHLAAGAGAPVVAIFGPTRPQLTGPRGRVPAVILQKDVGCNRGPCYFLECPENVCMKAVSVEEVLAAVQRLVKSLKFEV